MTPVPRTTLHAGGPEVSRIVLGLWRLVGWGDSPQTLLAKIERSIELGITTFDHADIYGNHACESLFGDAIRQRPDIRGEMEIVTKCGICLERPSSVAHYDTSAAHIIASTEKSLELLHVESIDILLIHRPDVLMDAGEVAVAFTTLRDAGKVHHFGVSNFLPHQFDLLQSALDFPLVTNQVEFSVLALDTLHDGTLDRCQELGISPMAWSPFGGGRLFSDNSEQVVRVRSTLEDIRQEVSADHIDQIALAWLLKHPTRVVPVIGSGKLERIRRAAESMRYELDREQWFRLWSACKGTSVP